MKREVKQNTEANVYDLFYSIDEQSQPLCQLIQEGNVVAMCKNCIDSESIDGIPDMCLYYLQAKSAVEEVKGTIKMFKKLENIFYKKNLDTKLLTYSIANRYRLIKEFSMEIKKCLMNSRESFNLLISNSNKNNILNFTINIGFLRNSLEQNKDYHKIKEFDDIDMSIIRKLENFWYIPLEENTNLCEDKLNEIKDQYKKFEKMCYSALIYTTSNFIKQIIYDVELKMKKSLE